MSDTEPIPTDAEIDAQVDRMAEAAYLDSNYSDVVMELRSAKRSEASLLRQIAEVRTLAEGWRYKGAYGGDPRQEDGPDEEGRVLDGVSAELLAVLDRALSGSTEPPIHPMCCWKCFTDSGTTRSPFMMLCGTCGNKRCPRASDHSLDCSGSNESGQPGSVYAARPVAPDVSREATP